jgi:hypothetical protein
MAGLLTYSLFDGLPILQVNTWNKNSGMRLPKSIFKSLQQRELFPIFTGFPIMTLSVPPQVVRMDGLSTPLRDKSKQIVGGWYRTLIFFMIYSKNSFYFWGLKPK